MEEAHIRIGNAPEPVPAPKIPVFTGCSLLGCVVEFSACAPDLFDAECIQRRAVAGHGDAGIIAVSCARVCVCFVCCVLFLFGGGYVCVRLRGRVFSNQHSQ